ncbi:MAG: hypothetical protein RLZZ418_292 [Pseudomonadota bacterium]
MTKQLKILLSIEKDLIEHLQNIKIRIFYAKLESDTYKFRIIVKSKGKK